ncbi:hypothetical protein [Wolbachia endosymbiont of Drosophila barbarae]|uniref:hypothetical protein n=1 Tax=Wolbachia endosymbiont of Drosophila barbarae TaxID=3377043 RepID=UPI00381887A7
MSATFITPYYLNKSKCSYRCASATFICHLQIAMFVQLRVSYLDDTVERNEPPFQNCFE